MTVRNWSAIGSGATFEALVSSIISFEEKGAKLFGRPGMDGGQDARSRDGSRVFQAKFHRSESATEAIRDAKKEAENIRKHLLPGAPRFDQWRNVTHWRLVTNAAFNPSDVARWEKDVVPLFRNLGLVAEYWAKADLDVLLNKHSEIHRSFFEYETRAFYSMGEVKERLRLQEPFLHRQELADFCGRTGELSKILDFLLSSERFLVVHGAGGMGKTRLLVEAGEMEEVQENWQVLWANVASMTASGAWFGSVNPEQPTVLLIDEPPDEEILRLLSEQLGGRVSQWKIIVAVRSPKDPVLRFLFGPRIKRQVRELAIEALPQKDAELMCYKLLLSGRLASLPESQLIEAARALSKRFNGIPVWLTLAVQLFEERGELTKIPESAKDLANEYLDEIERSQSQYAPEIVRALIRWIALLGTVNQQDESSISLLGEATKVGGSSDVRRSLASLISRRAIVQRGAAGRFVELKPDVLRDHVLLSWLSVDSGLKSAFVVASDEAKGLVEAMLRLVVAGKVTGIVRSILLSIARTELLLKLNGHDLQLLASFLEEIHSSVPNMTASQRLTLADLLEAIAQFQPEATTRIIGALRQSNAVDEVVEGLFGARLIGQKDVILALAWSTFHAAMGAQTAKVQETVLRELCALVMSEAEIAPQLKGGLPNDGKRAAALVERVLQGGPEFWAAFDSVAGKIGSELLDLIAHRPPTPSERALLMALILPALTVERRQSWSDGSAIHFRTIAIGTEHPGWTTRTILLSQIQQLLASDLTPPESRILLWQAFAESHSNVNQLYRQTRRATRYSDFTPTQLRSFLWHSFPGANWKNGLSPTNGGKPSWQHDALLRNLMWAKDLLERRHASLGELSAARSLWNWHRHYESNKELKAVAERLEEIYARNDLAAEFEPLLARNDYKHHDLRAAAKAADLSAASTPEEIREFVNRAISFLGAEEKLSQMHGVAWELGKQAGGSKAVNAFVEQCLVEPQVSATSDFAAVVASTWIANVRKGSHAERAHVLVTALMARCGSDEQRANLLLRIYGRIPRILELGEFTTEEHCFIRSQRSLFKVPGYRPALIAMLAHTLNHKWVELRPLLDEILWDSTLHNLGNELRALVEAVYWALRESKSSDIPADLNVWLLNQLIQIPDFETIGGHMEWHLEEIFGRIGPLPVTWLPGALSIRVQREQESKKESEPRVRAVGSHARISKYVREVELGDITNEFVSQAIDDLLNFVPDKGTVGYRLQEILRDVDPNGLLIPKQVVSRISDAGDENQLWLLARVGGTYSVGSEPWKIIAKAAIVSGQKMGADLRSTIFPALESERIKSWSGIPGEVSPIFIAEVDAAKSALEAETDGDLKPFWQWRLECAEAEYRRQEEFAKEERGE